MKSGVEDFPLRRRAGLHNHPSRRPANVGRRDRLFDRLNDLLDCHWRSNDGPYVHRIGKCIFCA
jgi:hypothetical protein